MKAVWQEIAEKISCNDENQADKNCGKRKTRESDFCAVIFNFRPVKNKTVNKYEE